MIRNIPVTLTGQNAFNNWTQYVKWFTEFGVLCATKQKCLSQRRDWHILVAGDSWNSPTSVEFSDQLGNEAFAPLKFRILLFRFHFCICYVFNKKFLKLTPSIYKLLSIRNLFFRIFGRPRAPETGLKMEKRDLDFFQILKYAIYEVLMHGIRRLIITQSLGLINGEHLDLFSELFVHTVLLKSRFK